MIFKVAKCFAFYFFLTALTIDIITTIKAAGARENAVIIQPGKVVSKAVLIHGTKIRPAADRTVSTAGSI